MNVRTVKLSPEQWVALLQKYGVPASSLTGKGCSVSHLRRQRPLHLRQQQGPWRLGVPQVQ